MPLVFLSYHWNNDIMIDFDGVLCTLEIVMSKKPPLTAVFLKAIELYMSAQNVILLEQDPHAILNDPPGTLVQGQGRPALICQAELNFRST